MREQIPLRQLRDNTGVTSRRIWFSIFAIPALCLAQAAWQTVVDLPGVDWQGLTGPKKLTALQAMRVEGCDCGCGMKVAECRVKDPACGVSRKLAKAAVKSAGAGNPLATVKLDLHKEDPVVIPLEGTPMKGAANARVTIVEYSDFQCPYCAQSVKQVNLVLAKYPKDVRVFFKQFPLDQHAQAEIASEAALAAHNQGKFWQLHDKVYADFRDLSVEHLLLYAKQIGLDTAKFRAELESHKWEKEVAREREEGENFGVSATPTFFINGKKYNGSFELSQVSAVIERELK